MNECLICKTKFEPFINFGQMPIANGFLGEEQFKDEYTFEMKVGFCPHCKMVQLLEQPDREQMFHENYAFFSSTSKHMAHHFKDFANSIKEKYLPTENAFVVEMGSNDGIMLKNFKEDGIAHLGIEPSKNVADVARESGINTISEFFDEKVAQQVVDQYSQADAILAANCMCHIPYLHSVVAGFKKLLKPKGVIVFEDPYLGDIVEKTSYDQIYDEHTFYFSLSSVSYLFAQYDIEVIDVNPQSVHGGSMRYTLAHKGAYEVSSKVTQLKEAETVLGLTMAETFTKFSRNVQKSKDDLMNLLNELKQANKRVVGYAATSKSTTITNYCGITPEHVEFISDTTPIKQGKYSPGVHIPVKAYDEFKTNYPDYALLFGWNHAKEIMANEEEFISSGGQWIVYVPEVKVIDYCQI